MTDVVADKRILVVEDEYLIASDLARTLEGAGAEVVGPVGDPERGLSLAKEEALDAALLDVNLDGETSFAVAERLAARGVPFAFLTGYDDWALPDAYRSRPRLAKPFAMSNVLVIVRRLLAAVPA